MTLIRGQTAIEQGVYGLQQRSGIEPVVAPFKCPIQHAWSTLNTIRPASLATRFPRLPSQSGGEFRRRMAVYFVAPQRQRATFSRPDVSKGLPSWSVTVTWPVIINGPSLRQRMVTSDISHILCTLHLSVGRTKRSAVPATNQSNVFTCLNGAAFGPAYDFDS